MAEALYRKYRPQVFGDVVGQDHIERTLRNAIEQDKVSHAYLFCGPRGTGKTTTARLLAKALLCERGQGRPTPDPDGTCEDCQLIAEGSHPDVYELDAASRTGVENVREEIIGRVQFAPARGRCKVYIIDEVHMLSTAAFNALLKTLEEPPDHVVFILATTDPQKVPETIHSRCQRFDFHRIGTEGMVARLGAVCEAEGVTFEGEALELIAHRAEGGMRNALTSLEQLIAFGEGSVTLEVAERMLGGIDSSDLATIMRAVGERDAAACFRWVASYVETGADLIQFARDMAAHVRNLYVMALAGADVALEVGATERTQLARELPMFGPDRLARLLDVMGDTLAELKTSTNQRLTFEIALTRMVRPESDLTLSALAERVETLERALALGGGMQSRETAVIPTIGTEMAMPGAAAEVRQDEGLPVSAPVSAPVDTVTAAPASVRADAPVAELVAQGGSMLAAAPVTRVEPAAQAASAAQVAPAAQAEPVVRTAGEGLAPQLVQTLQNPAALQRMWQTALTSLKRVKPAYGVLFMSTRAVFDQGAGALRIEFPAENVFAFKASQKPEVQDAVGAALQQAAGQRIPFFYVQDGASEPQAASPTPVVQASVPAAQQTRSVQQTASSQFAQQVSAAQPVQQSAAQHSAQPSRASQVRSAPAAAQSARDARAAASSSGTSAFDEPSSEPMPWEYGAEEWSFEPNESPAPAAQAPTASPQPLPPEPPTDANSSATPLPQDSSVDDAREAITSVFGDGVVFDVVD